MRVFFVSRHVSTLVLYTIDTLLMRAWHFRFKHTANLPRSLDSSKWNKITYLMYLPTSLSISFYLIIPNCEKH
ncbi:hypothetical protein F5Y15DRAFT_398054 [Xylariaceae sp. FL0016]|nr:hypothetical protein F5Y15DRAFT_398054 [Xylariaceae sp. FL0016]